VVETAAVVLICWIPAVESTTTEVSNEPPASADGESPSAEYAPREVLVVLEEGADPLLVRGRFPAFSDLRRIHAGAPAAHQRMTPPRKRLSRSYRVELGPGANVEEAVRQFRRDPDVEYAEPNYLASAFLVPNDALYSQQWSHQITEAEAGWDFETGDPGVVIAVVDSGVDYAHEDLAANIWDDGMGNPGRDFVDIDLRLGSRRLFGGR
jgi:subtilisin family serine protease